MTLVLYDLCMADPDLRPSPFCWIAKFALLHKGLKFETRPLRFAEKANYPDPDHGKVPILKDDDQIICDSANIIAHLEKHYPADSLTTTAGERAAAEFCGAWAIAELYPALAPMIVPRIYPLVHESDREYFRQTREERFGRPLHELSATPVLLEKIESALQTLAAPLARHQFLGGGRPNLSDYLVMAPFMWQRIVTDAAPYETPQAVNAWQERMLDLFDGYARKAKRAA